MTTPRRPPLAALDDAGLVTHTERGRVDAPLEAVWASVVLAPLEDVAPGGAGLAGVASTEALDDKAWGQDGAVRLVRLEDGSRAHEAVVEATPEDRPAVFRYQVWGLSGLPRLLVDHAQGRFVFEEAGGITELSWTYSFKPRSALLHPIVRGFVNQRFVGFMRSSMTVMRAHAEAA